MNQRLTLTLAGGLISLMGVVFFLGLKLQENRFLRQETGRWAASTHLLENQVAALAARTNELATQLERAAEQEQAAVVTASNAVAALAAEQAHDNDSARSQKPVTPRPYQLPVYLGQKHLGLAWVMPVNVKKDAPSGRVTCEHYIQLPEAARTALTTYVTNLVEQPVFLPPQVIERSVYVDRGYNYNWVGAHPGGGSGPVDPDFGRPPPARPPVPPGSSGIYVPPKPGKSGIYVPPGIR